MLIKAAQSCLFVVDTQERLLPHMSEPEKVVDNTRILLQAATRLDIPVLASEQYPRGLGPIVPPVSTLLPEGAVVEKIHFSCMSEGDFIARFDALGRGQAVVTGIEAHVCVLQTVEQLVERDVEVFVVADAMSSRQTTSHRAALERMAADGAHVVTTEMVVFEWMAKAGTPEFKELSALIK